MGNKRGRPYTHGLSVKSLRTAAKSAYNIARKTHKYYTYGQSALKVGKTMANFVSKRRVGNAATINARTGATTRLASKKSNLRRYKKPKNVKVSRTLRKKVKEVIKDEEARVAGTYSSYETPLVIRPETANKRLFITYPHYVKADGTGFQMYQRGEVFSPNLILDAASKLYKGKAATEDKLFFSGENFTPQNFFADVTYQKATFWLKNNMNRTITVKMYVCKSKGENNSNAENSNPVELFGNMCDTYDVGTADTNAPKSFNGLTASVVDSGLLETSYRNDPRFYPSFNRKWSVETVDFVMEPGQTSTQVIHGKTGPFNMLDHMSTNGEGGLTYQVNCKGVVYVMFSIMTDPIQVAAVNTRGELQYAVEQSASVVHKSVLIECERIIKMRVPERTLREYPGNFVPDLASTKGERTLVKEPRVFHEEYFGTPSGDVLQTRTDEEQPLGA